MDSRALGYGDRRGRATVSVVMPCYNAEAVVRDAVMSIVGQTFEQWELIVVDDNSCDRTVDIIHSISDTRIKVLRHECNTGYPTAMNTGINATLGKYIARMDADDISAPTRLEEQIKALENYRSVAFCGIARFRITPGGKMYSDRQRSKDYYLLETWEDLMQGSRIFTDPSVMIEREKLESVGGYRTFQKSGMDVDLWLRVMERYGPCVTITTPLFGKRLEPGSITFNPQTYLINQVPRVLARQRGERGSDDVQDGKAISLADYAKMGWIKDSDKSEKLGVCLGAIVTCLWLGDWKGAKIYFTQLRRNSNLSLAKIVFIVFKKSVQRMRRNPYVRNTLTV